MRPILIALAAHMKSSALLLDKIQDVSPKCFAEVEGASIEEMIETLVEVFVGDKIFMSCADEYTDTSYDSMPSVFQCFAQLQVVRKNG